MSADLIRDYWWLAVITVPLVAYVIKLVYELFASRDNGDG